MRNKTVKSGKSFVNRNKSKHSNIAGSEACVTTSTPWIPNKEIEEPRRIKSVAYSRRKLRKNKNSLMKGAQSQTNKIIMDKSFDGDEYPKVENFIDKPYVPHSKFSANRFIKHPRFDMYTSITRT